MRFGPRLSRLPQLMREFRCAEGGNVAVIFAIMLLPVVGMTGGRN